MVWDIQTQKLITKCSQQSRTNLNEEVMTCLRTAQNAHTTKPANDTMVRKVASMKRKLETQF